MGNSGTKIKKFFTKTIPKAFHSTTTWIKNKAVSAYRGVTGIVKGVYSGAKNIISGTYNKVNSIIFTVHRDARDFTVGVKNFANNTVGTIGSTTKSLGNNIETSIGSISDVMPWMMGIGVVGLAGYHLSKQK